ncbi:MAG: hypothetical protein IKT65_05970 [Clostridia bacterium]|nr:hypothetical protein [Clostridia bacterium]
MESKNALSKRKSTRLNGFDYGKTGAYFLTVCTENRKNILSTISVGEGSPLPTKGSPLPIKGSPLPIKGSPLPIKGSALPILSPCGEIVDRWIKRIPEKYPNAYVDRYVIMPNHIHILLSIVNDNEREDSHNDTFGRGDPFNDTFGRGDPSPTTTVNAVMGWLKYQATKEINQFQNTVGDKIFQRSFFDHIVRNYDDYHKICKYIYENPARWYYDKLYSEE